MIDWQKRLADKQARRSSFVKRTREVYGKLGGWIRRYRGGMPPGVMAAIIYAESGGTFGSAGDVSLGEIGYFQISRNTPGRYGLPADARRDPQTNVFLGGLDYNADAVRLYQRYPGLIELGTADSWKLAMLAFAIGAGGTRTLINRSGARRGNVFGAIKAYVDRTGGIPLGTQSAGKIWYRVHFTDYKWKAGRAAVAGGPGWPEAIPAPPGLSYRLEPSIRQIMSEAPSGLLTLILVGAFAYGVYRYST